MALFGVLVTAGQQSGSGALNPWFTSHEGAAFSDAFLAMAVVVLLTLVVAFRMRSPRQATGG
ncbi:hypothetical protein [Amycolatopsis magusensis]|uniref:Uncharacterized protein n=1 Tax=Amycolatopsis magusensis TaxID=882444 RepID=A0ABS4PR62_9PSEU|nr:hypothetical protein [Amycolatopsis magusensis]MBP2181385.1 hypothetical protein [Amycolatopsis magusensis]